MHRSWVCLLSVGLPLASVEIEGMIEKLENAYIDIDEKKRWKHVLCSTYYLNLREINVL